MNFARLGSKDSEPGRARMPALAILGVIVVIASSCSLGKGSAKPMSLNVIEGSATLIREGESHRVTSESDLAVGDRIELDADSLAELHLDAGRDFELAGAEVLVVGGKQLELNGGDLLADLKKKATINAGGLTIEAKDASFRVDTGLATRVGVYSRAASLKVDAEELTVPALRQAVVAADVLPKSPRPLVLANDDRWDRRFLGDVIELDRLLTNFGRGLEAQLGTLVGMTFFRRVAPQGLGVDFLSTFTAERRSDVLIGLGIAYVASGSKQTESTFASIFSLWRQGATWGLIAFEYGAHRDPLFALLLAAIDRAGIRFIGGLGPGLLPLAGPGTGNGRGGSANSPGGGGPGGGGGPPGPGGSPTPSPTLVPEPVSSVIPDDVEDPVNEIICDLIGQACPPAP